jgi:hypothetical protein
VRERERELKKKERELQFAFIVIQPKQKPTHTPPISRRKYNNICN